ncbi:glycosyltransferase [Nocardioides sp. SR21]|uniref:glycosyltransferase n=1 Tax=Nocardioides sp. SR21 TaxID=2919501 RepID=UPI001FAAF1C4|nr:glycosyltransferase [Nocardioides sp. SR21]
MIGYYVHHHGRGHLHRALAVAAELDEPVTVLSSLPPSGPGPWVVLDRDDDGGPARDVAARRRLHWAPLHDRGLGTRMQQISSWLVRERPRLVVVDVSVEVATLVRLHGVPVVMVVLPGRRDDPAHRLGFDLAGALVGAWPADATSAMLPGLPGEVHHRVHAVGALSRVPVIEPRRRRPGPPRVTVLMGAGGHDVTPEGLSRATASAPEWEWTVLGAGLGEWRDDPVEAVRDADVVVTHAGQNAVAEVAALRRPAVLVPQRRPHDEQVVAAGVLAASGMPVRVEDGFPCDGWSERLGLAAALPGAAWSRWCDGKAVLRFADLVAGES